jgi:hypothetical protein
LAYGEAIPFGGMAKQRIKIKIKIKTIKNFKKTKMKKINFILTILLVTIGSVNSSLSGIKLETKGSFSNVNSSVTNQTSYKSNISMPPLYGDFNGDCVVDLEDLIIVVNDANNFVIGGPTDLNMDGIVDLTDVLILDNLLCSYPHC